MWTRLLLAVLCLVVPKQANSVVHAESSVLADFNNIRVIVENKVTEGCLLNASGIENIIKSTMIANNITVDNNSNIVMKVLISGFDVEPDQDRLLCVVSVDCNLYAYYPGFGPVIFASDGMILFGPGHLDDEALGEAQAFTGEVVAAILQARMKADPRP
jgi:hypothetical protein